MKYKYRKYLVYIKQKEIIKHALLFTVVISSNFAAYLSYYDLNALMIIDSTTIVKYLLSISITYAIISTTVSIVLLFIQKYVLGSWSIFFKIKRLHDIIGHKVFKPLLTILIFMYIFVGMKNTCYIIGFSIVYILLLTFYNMLIVENPLNLIDIYKRFRKSKALNEKYYSNFISSAKTYFTKGNHLKFILDEISIFLIFFTLAVGIGRANYVETLIQVQVNSDQKLYTLYITTSNGIGLYDRKLAEVKFISWGNIKQLTFSSNKRRSFNIF